MPARPIWGARHLMVPLLPPVHVAQKENIKRYKNISFELNGGSFRLWLYLIFGRDRKRENIQIVRFWLASSGLKQNRWLKFNNAPYFSAMCLTKTSVAHKLPEAVVWVFNSRLVFSKCIWDEFLWKVNLDHHGHCEYHHCYCEWASCLLWISTRSESEAPAGAASPWSPVRSLPRCLDQSVRSLEYMLHVYSKVLYISCGIVGCILYTVHYTPYSNILPQCVDQCALSLEYMCYSMVYVLYMSYMYMWYSLI